MYIYLDESGNFRSNKEAYFIVGGFVTSDERITAKAFRKWQHTKFVNKKLRYRTEVKFSDSRLNDKLRLKTLLYFVQQNIRIFYTFFKTKNIPAEFKRQGVLESGRLYLELVAQTLSFLFPSAESQVIVTLDHRNLKGVTQAEFRETLRLHLRLRLSQQASVHVNIVNSTTNANIQIADWICGALYRYYTNRIIGKEFYKVLHNSIIISEELFGDYWNDLNGSNKKSPHER